MVINHIGRDPMKSVDKEKIDEAEVGDIYINWNGKFYSFMYWV